LFDIQGKQVAVRFEYGSGEIVANIKHLPAGTYILKISNETVKILKE